MTKGERSCGWPLTRRAFLAKAAGGAAAAGLLNITTAIPSQEATSPVEPAALDTGGIALEYFNQARKRAAAIIAKLTLEEKITQFGSSGAAVPRIGLAAFKFYGGEALHGCGKSGAVTSFPVPLALGCSWNRALMQQVFNVVSDEIWAWHKKSGDSLAMFSPATVNMGTRDPRWGRIAENYSEDPYLVGQMAIYTIHGMQGRDSKYLKTIACAKHYCGNDTEADRHETSATIDPRSFWEYYSRGFEACVKEGQVFTVMSSYNAVNGIPTTVSPFMLTELLRDRWGFRGYVVTDCDAVNDVARGHGFVTTFAEAAGLAVSAGCSIECGSVMQRYLSEAVKNLYISESTLDEALTRAFTGRILLGDLDPPDLNPYNKIPVDCLDSSAHRELAREAARQSAVLFKNENNTLPLDKGSLKTVAVLGPMAHLCQLGNYSGGPRFMVSPLKAIRDYFGIPPAPAYYRNANEFSEFGGNPDREGSHEGGENLQHIRDGAWAACPGLLFTGATKFTARVACDSAGGTIEAHLDSLDGELIAKLSVTNTGSGQTWDDLSAPIKPVTGEHTVYLRFSGGSGDLFKVTSISLSPAPPIEVGASGSQKVVYSMGCGVVGDADPAAIDSAVKAVRDADVALVFVGVNEQVDKESHDRNFIHLSGAQHDLVQAVFAANPRTILVVSSNAPVAINWEQENLPAIVGGLFLGEQQGNALVDVLFGHYNPGGKTSVTWYRDIEDLPDFHDYNLRLGRTYLYFRKKPLYPFGYGLSYTTFEYKNLRLSGKTLARGGKMTATFDLSNTGRRDGDEIVQLYVHCAESKVERPILQLAHFERVHLKAGETRTISLEVAHTHQALQYWDENKYDFVIEPGDVDLMIGASSADIRLRGTVQLTA